MRYLCRESNGSRPKAFLVLDGPNTDHITCRALASRRFEVAVTGPGGHSWSDYGAGNPVHALSRVIAEFTSADFAVGAPIANRARPELEPLIGLFVNTLALRADLGEDPAVGSLLAGARATALGAYAAQELPFERVVQEVAPDSNKYPSPRACAVPSPAGRSRPECRRCRSAE